MGAAAVGATIYFGSPESRRQIEEISEAFPQAHELGMATILWCYLRNNAFRGRRTDYHMAADLTGQANHLGVTIGADIIKQKQPENNGGFKALKFGKSHPSMYTESSPRPPDRPHPLPGGQLLYGTYRADQFRRRQRKNDLPEAVRTAVINKRAGGMGLISGRKAFQRPMKEGVELLHAIQEVYLSPEVTVA